MSKNVPKIRFKGFSDEWEEKKLGSLGTFLKGNGISKADLSETGEECILYGELYTKYGEVIDKVYSKTNIELKSKILSKSNDVLIPSSGETAIDIATASCVKQDNVLLGGDLNVFRPKNINGVFISYELNNSKKNEIAKIAQGASVVHIYNEQLKKLSVNLPSIAEQERIANFLTKVDKLIEKQDEKVSNLEQYKKGMMQKVFSQEIRFKKENGGEYPEWEEKTLHQVTDVLSGKRIPKGESTVDYNTGIKYITVSDMGEKYINDDNIKYIKKETEEKIKKYKVSEGDIIISVAGTLGKINLVSKNFQGDNLTENCDKITNFDGCNNIYIYYYLNTELIQNQIKSSNTVSSQPKLALERIRNFNIDVPSLDEQTKIANFLSNIDSIVEKEKEKLEEMRKWKKGLLQGMFV